MMQAYTTLKEKAAAEFIEKRSRFIGVAAPVKTENNVADLLQQIKAEHRDARHHCYAYALRSGAQRYSDDGEPQGTAGLPMLEVLRRENVTDGAIFVTRYFGGTLLGAPGLVRAYSHTAKLALSAAETVLMRPCSVAVIAAPYPFYDRICLLLQNNGAVLLNSSFAEHVSIEAQIPAELAASISETLKELTANKASLQITGEIFA